MKAWGDPSFGGTDPGIHKRCCEYIIYLLSFAALKSDGSVKVWGGASYGGTDPNITSGVVNMVF